MTTAVRPKLMLFSVTDDRSGVCYQDYCLVYGEEMEAVLRFLFRAMSPKEDFPFQGIPDMIYADNGPFAKSAIFKRVMECLDINFKTHMARDTDGRRTTARSKGKVERPFRTIKRHTRFSITNTNQLTKRKQTSGSIIICTLITTQENIAQVNTPV